MSVCGHAAFFCYDGDFFAEAKKQEQKFLLRREERDEREERGEGKKRESGG